MHDLTPEEVTVATKQGWGLFVIYDEQKTRWTLGVLPLVFTKTQGAVQALEFVINRAKQNDQLCIKALRAVTRFNSARTKK